MSNVCVEAFTVVVKTPWTHISGPPQTTARSTSDVPYLTTGLVVFSSVTHVTVICVMSLPAERCICSGVY